MTTELIRMGHGDIWGYPMDHIMLFGSPVRKSPIPMDDPPNMLVNGLSAQCEPYAV